LLQSNELTLVNGCVNHIKDSEGNEYIIPNYCINDPYFEKDLAINEIPDKADLNVMIYNIYNIYNIVIYL